jgi:hypothetical protein
MHAAITLGKAEIKGKAQLLKRAFTGSCEFFFLQLVDVKLQRWGKVGVLYLPRFLCKKQINDHSANEVRSFSRLLSEPQITP